jgi:hypothetical protein
MFLLHNIIQMLTKRVDYKCYCSKNLKIEIEISKSDCYYFSLLLPKDMAIMLAMEVASPFCDPQNLSNNSDMRRWHISSGIYNDALCRSDGAIWMLGPPYTSYISFFKQMFPFFRICFIKLLLFG